MNENFITLEEAAGFEGVSYECLKMRVYRNQEAFTTKTEPSKNGGKDRLLISIANLSRKARRAFREKQNIEGDIKQMILEENMADDMPWYVDADYNWYIENKKKYYYTAVEMAKHIEEYLEYNGPNKTEFAEEFADKLDMSSRSLFRKVKQYLEGAAWAIKMNQEDGKNYDFYKIFALCPKPKEKGLYPSMTTEMKVYIQNVWFDKNFAQNHGTVAMLYQALEKQSDLKGWDMPSYPTVNRYIKTLMETKSSAHYLLAQGTREWKRSKMIKARRDTGALMVMELIQGDSHTFDCWVSIKRDNGKLSAIKPVLTAFIDTRSRCFVGWGISEVPDSQIMKKVLLNMIYEKSDPEVPFKGVPKYLLIDNGKDFTAETLTGRPRNVRVDFDQETKGFYRSIGIQDEFRSLPYQAWSKAQIERSFGTVCSTFTKWLGSYVGTLTGSKTSEKIRKDIKKMLENGELMTLEEFTEKFGIWLKEVYHKKKHSGLKEQKEVVPIPIEVYMNAERYEKAAPPRSYAEMLLMKSEDALVRATGIRKFGYDYLADELGEYIGRKVVIRYNPDDITRIYVYNSEGKKICEALSQELLAIAPKVTQKKLEEHMRKQKRQLKRAMQDIEEMQTPFEERIAEAADILGNEKPVMLQELKEKESKVVTLPSDKQFRESLKNKKNEKKSNPETNDFFQKQAEEAFALLESM